MSSKKPKFNYIIICDDIRQEVGNKFSFIGVYAKVIFIPQKPFIFPKLCFIVSYGNMPGGSSFEAELIGPKGVQIGPAIKGAAPEKDAQHEKFDLHAIFSPVKIEEEGEYKFVVEFTNETKRRDETIFNIKVPVQKKD